MQLEPKRRKKGWMNLEITRIIEENNNTRTLFFRDAVDKNCPFDYDPGQYLTFRFEGIEEKTVIRSYTMSSAPHHQDIAVTVKALDQGSVSRYLVFNSKVGDNLKAMGPIGKFCYFPDTDPNNLVMIAAGSGVTPFISMIEAYTHPSYQSPKPTHMTLFVSFRNRHEMICFENIQRLRKHPRCTIKILLTQDRAEHLDPDLFFPGRIGEEFLNQHLNLDQALVMSCGPEAFMNQVKEHLSRQNFDMTHFRTESF